MTVFDRLGNKLEGKGKTILYGLIGLVVVGALVGFYVTWNNRKKDEARRALGRAIAIASTPVSPMSPSIDPNAPKFTSERDRAQKSIEEFQKVMPPNMESHIAPKPVTSLPRTSFMLNAKRESVN